MSKCRLGTNDRIVKMIDERLRFGQEKYGQDMQLSDGRDLLQETLEELLDACVYLSAKLLKLKDEMPKYRANELIGKDY